MSNKRKGQLTVSGEWAKHLRPGFRRIFWKHERQAAKVLVNADMLVSGKGGSASEMVQTENPVDV